ncbi:MAG: DNA methylase, partial [Chloroflexi bacterium]|nr:DNA methylase [Chloroflexota bacterium]
MIEKLFDVPFVAALALREKQIQQNYRPIIAVHKWFARRPGTLFRSLILSEFGPGPLRETYYSANKLTGISIADPLMGGGTPLIEANRMGCNIIGYDINPLAYWIVRQEIEHLDLTAYRDAANKLTHSLAKIIGRFYRTACPQCGIQDAHVKYFLWVKTTICRQCGKSVDLFPGYLLAENQRHPNNVFICANCGDLSETKDRTNPRSCQWCAAPLARSGPARQGTCKCPDCGTSNTYPNPRTGAPTHRMFAIEYHCPRCKPMQQGRLFKKPDTHDLQRYDEAEATWRRLQPVFVPDDEIPAGDETDRLHRWGYRYYWQMFNPRQLLALELSCRAIAEQDDLRLRNALATNLSDL